MFYKQETEISRAVIVLRPSESKRLIAKAIAKIPEVVTALSNGTIIVAGGTTNGFIAQELTGRKIDVYRYTAGRIWQGKLNITPEAERIKPFILIDGEISSISMSEALDKFGAKDVFIKGANAVDPKGNAGVLVANPQGGTVGTFWSIVAARGANLICPVGLEKLIPSVETAIWEAGQNRIDFADIYKVGLLQLPNAKVVTEIQAIEILYGLVSTHIASGGIDGSEGSVVLSVKGGKAEVEKMWNEIAELKR
jgi:hypothetical protein